MRAAAEPLLSCNIPKYIYIYITNICTPSISNKYIANVYTPNISQYVRIGWCCFYLMNYLMNWALLPSHDCRATFPNTYKSISLGYIPQIHMNIYPAYIRNTYPKYIHPRFCFNVCKRIERYSRAMTIVQHSQIHINVYLKKYIPQIFFKYIPQIYVPRYISTCVHTNGARWGAGVEYHFQEIRWALRPVVNGT